MITRATVERRRSRGLLTLAVVALLGLSALACNFSFGMGEPRVESVTVCEDLDEDYAPVNPTDAFEATDEPCVSVEVANLKEGSTVKARWLLAGSPISEVSYTAEDGGSGYVGFRLTPDPVLPAGDYVVEIQLDGESVGSGSFAVTGDATPVAEEPASAPTTEPIPTEAARPTLRPTPTQSMPQTQEMVTFSDWGMSVDVPADWSMTAESDTLLSLGSPDGDKGAFIAYSELESGAGIAAEDFVTAFAEGFAGDYPDLEYTFSQAIMVGGVEGYEQDVAWTDEGTAMEGIFVGVVPDNRAYIFAFIMPASQYDEALPTFQAMMDSVELEGTGPAEEPADEPSDEPGPPPSGDLCYVGEVTKKEDIGQTQIMIWGHVIDANGDPVGGTVVDIKNEWGLSVPVRTDANGGYSQDGITADIEWEMSLPELDSQPVKVKLEFGKRFFVDWMEQPCP